jgi:hypothetical protein
MGDDFFLHKVDFLYFSFPCCCCRRVEGSRERKQAKEKLYFLQISLFDFSILLALKLLCIFVPAS